MGKFGSDSDEYEWRNSNDAVWVSIDSRALDNSKKQYEALGTAIPKLELAVQSDGSSTDYYKFPKGYDDLIDLIEYRNMSFSVGNIFKACFRLGRKHGVDDLYDLRKIKFFVEREIARIENSKSPNREA